MDIFSKTWWHHHPGGGRASQHTYIPVNLDKVFARADHCSLLVLDACDEFIVQGQFLMVGKEIDLHIIRDGKVIFFAEDKNHDNFFYPYNPVDHPFEFNKLARMQAPVPVGLWTR